MKPRGRKPTTGTCATREELRREVHWYYTHTTMSIEAIGARFGISQGAANKALKEALHALSRQNLDR